MTRQLAISTTTLTYAMTTNPNPIEVSTSPATPALATLIFVVSCPRAVGSCTVSQLTVQLPVGDVSDATNLTNVAPSASAASISASDGAGWTPSLGVSPGLFIFSPPGESVQLSEQSLTIQLAGIQVSPMVGTADITIHEWVAPGSYPAPPPSKPPTGRAVIPAAKFPSGFYAFDFAASAPQVNSGESVTLSWIGSDNADYFISYADQKPARVTGGTWESPPLFTTTVFILTAQASAAGQTVDLKLNATVIVAAPQVVEFYADPSEIDYQQPVTLHWRAVNADGVYLTTGQTQRQSLGPVSDPAYPLTLQPSYGGSYSLQAYKNVAGSLAVSTPAPLAYTFYPMEIRKFSADPTTVTTSHPSTTLSWTVLHAKSVTLQGTTVPLQGSSPEQPTSDTTYNLVATWVDGSQVAAEPVPVKAKLDVDIQGVSAKFESHGAAATVYLYFTVANATSVSVSDAVMVFRSATGQAYGSSPLNAAAQRVDATHWTAQLTFYNLDGNAIGYPNAGLRAGYKCDGYDPITSAALFIWRGQF